MPAKIVVISGPDQGKETWIEDDVARIGRGTNCTILLSDKRLPDHVATLEFRDGHFNLYSRMEDEVVLGGKKLPPRGFDRWASGKDLVLPGQNVLRLETERDPRPAKKPRQSSAAAVPELEVPMEEAPAYEEDEEPVKKIAPDVAAKKRSKQMTQILLILLCALGGVYLFFLEEDPGAGPVQSPGAEFSYLVGTMYEKKADDPRYQDLRETLQVARTAELRSDTRTALKTYGILRDTLVFRVKTSREPLEKKDRELLEQTLKFVTVRLRTATDDAAAE